MPQFPTYQSQGQVDVPNKIAPEERGGSPALDATRDLADTVGKISEKWLQLDTQMQYNKAMIGAMTALTQQEQAAAQDPDPNNKQAHLNAIQSIQSSATDGIGNSLAAERAQERIAHEALLSGIKIDTMFKKKQMFANDQQLDQYATLAAQNKSDAITEAAGQQVEQSFMGAVQANAASGLISPTRADQLVRAYKVGVVKNDSMKDKSTDASDSQVLKNLNDGKYDLTLSERNQAEKMIHAKINQNKQAEINEVMKYRTDIIKGIANGDQSWKNPAVIDKVALKDPKLSEAMQAVLTADAKGSPYVPEKDQNQNFAEMVGKMFSTNTKEEMSEHYIDALKSNANRNMSTDRLSILIGAAESRTATLPTNKQADDAKPSQTQLAIDNSVKGIQSLFKGAQDEMSRIGQTVGNFFRNLSGGAAPAAAQQQAVQQYNLTQYSWISHLPKDGEVFRDKITGAKRRVYPDGSWKDE